MKNIGDYLQNRAQKLDLGRGNALVEIQEELNKLYPGKVRAKRLSDGELTITTPSAAVAGDLRMRQRQLLEKLKKHKVINVKISIT